MKHALMGICVSLIVVAAASLYSSRAQEAASDNAPPTVNWAAGNPLKIGLLKWYQANTVPTYFTVGKTQNSKPYGLAFDGQNIWTANSEGTVTKLRASDGAVLGQLRSRRRADGHRFRWGEPVGASRRPRTTGITTCTRWT